MPKRRKLEDKSQVSPLLEDLRLKAEEWSRSRGRRDVITKVKRWSFRSKHLSRMGDRMRHQRRSLKSALARKSKVSHPVVGRLLNGKPIRVQQAEKIARFLGYTLALKPIRN